MNITQLQCCIQCDRILRDHVTVCAADHLPVSLTAFPYAFIVNTENHIQREKTGALFTSIERDAENFLTVMAMNLATITTILTSFLKSMLVKMV